MGSWLRICHAMQRYRNSLTNWAMDMRTDRPRNNRGPSCRQSSKQTDRRAAYQTDRQTDRQLDGQSDITTSWLLSPCYTLITRSVWKTVHDLEGPITLPVSGTHHGSTDFVVHGQSHCLIRWALTPSNSPSSIASEQCKYSQPQASEANYIAN